MTSDITLKELRRNQEILDKASEDINNFIQKTIINPLIIKIEEINKEKNKMTDLEKFRQSKTYQNLLEAYAGESQARVKYEYYASKAKKDGFVQIANIFEETSKNEKEHAKIWFKLLHDGVPHTTDNLQDAIDGETYEHDIMYDNFAKEAYAEGYDEIGDLFSMVGDIENHHARRYQKLYDNIKKEKVFKRNILVSWKCGNCGHIHVGEEAPDVCPVCNHPKSYFEILNENY